MLSCNEGGSSKSTLLISVFLTFVATVMAIRIKWPTQILLLFLALLATQTVEIKCVLWIILKWTCAFGCSLLFDGFFFFDVGTVTAENQENNNI